MSEIEEIEGLGSRLEVSGYGVTQGIHIVGGGSGDEGFGEFKFRVFGFTLGFGPWGFRGFGWLTRVLVKFFS